MFNNFKFSKKEECPCRSGKKFGECCYLKEERKFHSEKEALAILSKNARKSRINICLYNKCKSKAIGAHALQENGVLSNLAVNKKVLIQNKKEDATIFEIQNGMKEPLYFLSELLIKDATVQTCFCGEHDNKIFEDIEKHGKEFLPTNLKQLFLFAYRTFSFEYYSEVISNKFYQNMFKDIPQFTRNPIIVSNYRESSKKKEEMDYYKNYFDEIIANEKYSELATLVIELPYEIKFANYMCIAPDFDLMGNKINVFDKETKMMRRVFITSFSKEDKSYILISVLKKDLLIYERYLKCFEEVSQEVIKYYFNSIIPLISENLILSPELWNEWDEIGQALIQVAVSEPNPNIMLTGLKLMLHNLAIKGTADFILRNVKYNIFGKYNLGAKIKIIKNQIEF